MLFLIYVVGDVATIKLIPRKPWMPNAPIVSGLCDVLGWLCLIGGLMTLTSAILGSRVGMMFIVIFGLAFIFIPSIGYA